MPKLVTNGASLSCNQGVAPASLTVLPGGCAGSEQPIATVNDFVPMKNIAPFGMCRSLANPQVQAATAAAAGTLTPQPCIPVITAPWAPGLTGITVGVARALSVDSKCACSWAGEIQIVAPGVDGLEGR